MNVTGSDVGVEVDALLASRLLSGHSVKVELLVLDLQVELLVLDLQADLLGLDLQAGELLALDLSG